LVARVRSKGGWLDLNARKLVAPPDKLLAAMRRAPRSEDFHEVASSLKEGKG
jgi:acyl-CoA thioester hydrolase